MPTAMKNLPKQLQNHPVASEAESTDHQPLNNPKPAGAPEEGNHIRPAAGGKPVDSIKYQVFI